MPTSAYRKEQEARITLRIRDLQKDLPTSAVDYLRSLTASTTALTRLGYAYDLRLFFRFLCTEQVAFSDKEPCTFGLEDLRRVTLRDLEMYQDYLKTYVRPDEQSERPDFITNEEEGISRKLSAVRSFFKYLYTHEYLPENVSEKLRMPKLRDRPVVYLDRNEVQKLINTVETGEGMSERQQKYLENSRIRDLAIVMLLVGTGIRESELIGMDLGDVDLEEKAFVVTRKGGDQVILYFNDSIRDALSDYIALREKTEALPGHEEALFLSSQRKRIATRSVQNLVKKYAAVAAPLKKKISPHKLRSTFATTLYRKTGDIYQVSKTLGHKSVTTTKKYAQESEDSNRRAAESVDWV